MLAVEGFKVSRSRILLTFEIKNSYLRSEIIIIKQLNKLIEQLNILNEQFDYHMLLNKLIKQFDYQYICF